MKIEVSQFSSENADILFGLSNSAFKSISVDFRPKESIEFIRHLNGKANPAGLSICAVAFEESQCVGNVTAIPIRFLGKTGYQIGGFFVDQKYQGRGLGKKLLLEITYALREKKDTFIYTFPNARSIGIFYKLGYRLISRIPTYIFPWKKGNNILEAIEPKEISIENLEGFGKGGIIRDQSFFNWRYCGPGSENRYKFLIGKVENKLDFVVITSKHNFKRITFTIIVDILASSTITFLKAINAAQKLGKMVYMNTNAPHEYLPFARVPIPERFNQRSVYLLVYPGDFNSGSISQGIITGDWFGF